MFLRDNILKNLLPLIDCLLSNEFVSGESIAKKLNVSRTTVSEWIGQLLSYGLTVHRVKGKGYRLVEPLQLLNKDKIVRSVGEGLEQLSVIDIAAETLSTNKTAASVDYRDERWKLFATEYQHSGRGRRGRQWISPFGSNLLFSLGKKTCWDSSTLYGASVVAGLSIANTLQSFVHSPVKIKWPNDIYIHDCKVAGILCEIQGNPVDEALLVIGVGLNIFTSPRLEDKETGHLNYYTLREIDRNLILGQLVAAVISSINKFKGFQEGFMDEWTKLDYLYGREVELHRGDEIFRGIARGIDDKGQFKLLEPSNQMLVFNSGEVSVRW